MRRALRAHLRDVLAIIALLAAALFATTVILINQRTSLPSWVPLIGTDRFALEAEFSTAQAVIPGQGQSVDIAGIKVGEISGVKLTERPRRGRHGRRQQVRAADPRGLLAPAPSEDRAQRHGRRGRSGHPVEPAGEGELDDPARLDPAAGQSGRVPRLARRRHPAVPQAPAGERRGGPRPRAGPRREALQRAPPAGPLRPGHRPHQRRARHPPAEHRQLDPQLPAALHRARQQGPGSDQLRGRLRRRARLVRQAGGLDPKRPQGAARHAEGDARAR